MSSTGIETLDEVLQGGLPVGAVSELVGPECSGRTSLALSFLARVTQLSKVCAWIDVSNAFDPASAAAIGVDLDRLLWVRCGALQQRVQSASHRFALPQKYLVPPVAKKGLHGGGFGPHPRTEANGLSEAVRGLFRPDGIAGRYGELERCQHPVPETSKPNSRQPLTSFTCAAQAPKPWSRIEQGLRATDLLLQAGGFSAIVLDMGSLSPEAVSRVPLATWHRYRLAAERTQSSIVLVTQYACAKSSAELVLRLLPGEAVDDKLTVFTGIEHRMEVVRKRFNQTPTNVIPLKKPPVQANAASWHSRMAWVGSR
ncbi:MAG TPA: recombinase RecA [Acidobacteriaceae bacterium]|nr:recombinase RecA [Acidobacteriaceae bacterium]